MATHKLSAAKVRTLIKPGRYADGGNLWLQVSQGVNGPTKAWLFRFMLDGRARQMGLGSVDTFSLAEARERALAARKLVADRIDPIEHRDAAIKARRAAEAKRITFQEAAEKYIAAHRKGWKSKKHAAQWSATLAAHAYPKLGALTVDAIETGHVMATIEPIWSVVPDTASRLRGRIESILSWATVRGFRHGDNPARWRGHLSELLPQKNKVAAVTHYAAMPFGEVGRFMAELRGHRGVTAAALEFLVLTAARTGEVVGAKWQEVDFETKVWTLPASRTKSGRIHQVPLSDRVIELLRALPRLDEDAGYLFPGGRPGRPLSNTAMLELLGTMRPSSDITVHGFRSSFRDWCGDVSGFPRELAEAALAHIVADQTERAYRRGDALEKRRRLMQTWADFCARGAAEKASVVPLRRKGR